MNPLVAAPAIPARRPASTSPRLRERRRSRRCGNCGAIARETFRCGALRLCSLLSVSFARQTLLTLNTSCGPTRNNMFDNLKEVLIKALGLRLCCHQTNSFEDAQDFGVRWPDTALQSLDAYPGCSTNGK